MTYTGEEKAQVVEMFKGGRRVSEIAVSMGIPKHSISDILKKYCIENTVETATQWKAKEVVRAGYQSDCSSS
jgi:transposase-like protein